MICSPRYFFIHVSDMAIALNDIHGNLRQIYVYKRNGIGKSSQSFRPIPKPNKKNAAMGN